MNVPPKSGPTDIFDLHREIVRDYQAYIESFVQIADSRILQVVKEAFAKGQLWPAPLLQLNPAFEEAGTLDALVENGMLHPRCAGIFAGYRLYRHQQQAIELGIAGRDFVVTSGTGSGKSLTYLGTIFNHLFSAPSPMPPGITAVAVYPLNALINSQEEELRRYAANYENAYQEKFPIRFAKFTGQEKLEERQRIEADPPHILLTNYMMLELLLTRSSSGQQKIREAIYDNLRFLVFDELHTYRGRQGADVGMLIRRIRTRSKQSVTCIGTSATMASGDGTIAEQKMQIAKVANELFGKPFSAEVVVRERLQGRFGQSPTLEALIRAVSGEVDPLGNEANLSQHPTLAWIESCVALAKKDGELVRRKPMTMAQIVDLLATQTGQSTELCDHHLRAILLWISQVNANLPSERRRYAYLPFKLHQFISQTGAVYVSLDAAEVRHVTLQPGYHVPTDSERPLYTAVFSRYSGETFLCVTKDVSTHKLRPRQFYAKDDQEEDTTDGYLIPNFAVWNASSDLELLPDSWIEDGPGGTLRPIKKYRGRVPSRIWYNAHGSFSDTPRDGWREGWFMSAPLLFDPTSGVMPDRQTRDSTKLSQLGAEGRSTATSITSYAILTRMAEHGVSLRDQKLLSFTDNRQDAALQAGHFNDFLDVVRLRSAIRRAVETSPTNTLRVENVGRLIRLATGLHFEDFANAGSDLPDFRRRSFEETFETYLAYRAVHDLRRGWRVVLPNLEQCALLQIDYAHLDELVEHHASWENVPLLDQLSVADRREVIRVTLDFFRHDYALHSEAYLTESRISENSKSIRERLKAPFVFEDEDDIPAPTFVRIDTLSRYNRRRTRSIGPQSGYGKFIRFFANEKAPDLDLSKDAYDHFIGKLLSTLEHKAGYLASTPAKNRENHETLLYQLRLSEVIWTLGDQQTVRADSVKLRSYKALALRPNVFFQKVYLREYGPGKFLFGADHTGQLGYEDKISREERFRADWQTKLNAPDTARIRRDAISALFCSPTMELGIDIGGLSVVHLRNAPPNPANYAQRGGRAGRSGQPALVFTFCGSQSNHDRHYFKNQPDLVAGTVVPPRLDLLNEELLRTHLHALYLSEIGLPGLKDSVPDLIDMNATDLPLQASVEASLQLQPAEISRVRAAFERALTDKQLELPAKCPWFASAWIERELGKLREKLSTSLERWRTLHKSAVAQRADASNRIDSGLYPASSDEFRRAQLEQRLAQKQLDLLRNEAAGREISEFYVYRYLAAEGFLPGYNFTRLPLRVMLPGSDASVEFISRPRHIALREFGPNNVLYHKGQKYEITQLVGDPPENRFEHAVACIKSGYFLRKADAQRDHCPFSGQDLTPAGNKLSFHHLIDLGETRATQRSRITCEEEERVTKGYNITTYFTLDDLGRLGPAGLLKTSGEILLKLRYLPTARLVWVNQQWRVTKEQGFPVDSRSGVFISQRKMADLQEKNEPLDHIKTAMFYTTNVADALYLEPVPLLGLDESGVLTLQYALKRAIERTFQVEPSEIGVALIGDPTNPNIMLYEAAEGTLGVLHQFAERPGPWHQVIKAAIDVCQFDADPSPSPASYDNLLDYYNQRYHPQLDRWKIKTALEQLQLCSYETTDLSKFADYDTQYRSLSAQIDKNSSTEKVFLDYLYTHGLHLPESAQKTVDGIYVQPDFYYDPGIWVFVDGTPHDKPEVQADDGAKRQAIRNAGGEVIVWRYDQPLGEFVQKRSDIFRRVRD